MKIHWAKQHLQNKKLKAIENQGSGSMFYLKQHFHYYSHIITGELSWYEHIIRPSGLMLRERETERETETLLNSQEVSFVVLNTNTFMSWKCVSDCITKWDSIWQLRSRARMTQEVKMKRSAQFIEQDWWFLMHPQLHSMNRQSYKLAELETPLAVAGNHDYIFQRFTF